MKKFLAILLALLLVLGMVACGATTETTTESTEKTETATTEKKEETKTEDKQEETAPATALVQKQLDSFHIQMGRIYDFFEQGIYTPAEFVKRRDELSAKIAAAEHELERMLNAPTPQEIIRAQLPQIRYVLDVYPLTKDLEVRNMLLKSVIEKVDYRKTKKCTRADNPADYMELDIYPALPKRDNR